MKEYSLTQSEVFEELKSSASGLSEEEVQARRNKYGLNKLDDAKQISMFQRFLAQLKDPMLIILLIAAGVSAITNIISHESLAEVFIILVVVVLNAALGVLQESKAEEAIKALQSMTEATCKVIRGGVQLTVPSVDLVPGDIVVLEAGDSVPADGRLIESASLKIEEAALTGESVPVNKMIDVLRLKDVDSEVALGDRKNMCYMGSTAVYGRGKAVITATGMDTEMGKIANALTEAKDEMTPLQKRLNELGKSLSYIVLLICVLIFAFTMFKTRDFSLTGILNVFMIAVSLAVAAIPEGLATVVTVVLSIGVTKMSKRNAVIRKMTAVETLGCTTVICSDKTGTLTQNKMTVVDSLGDRSELAMAMALCCDAILTEEGQAEGEPTEVALVNFAYKEGIDKGEALVQMPRLSELPFDSGRKMMTTIHSKDDVFVQYTKGAPDVILSKCTTYLENGEIRSMTESKRAEIIAYNKSLADQALRVLAAARRVYSELPTEINSPALENELCFIGLTGMIDPIRPEVKVAITECRMAGIRPVMITGDHKDTAVAIAKSLGIIDDVSEAITGAELNELDDEQFARKITQYGVYARVQPEHKVRIVKTWQSLGAVTAMTGDGVNDAPSIKNADIGIGMGITGTDVTKNVADMVLTDDNFATIVHAVEEGRKIYDNIRKSILFLLSSNVSEVLSVFIATILGFVLLKPAHLLFINLITDCFPALALGLEAGEEDIMKRRPRSSKDGIFAGGLGTDLIYQGITITLITLASYIIGHSIDVGYFEIPSGVSAHGMTMAFLTMNMCEIFHSFNMRSQRNSIFMLKGQNKVLLLAMIGSLILATSVIEIPIIAKAFGFTPVDLQDYVIAIVLAFMIIPIVECVKLFQRKYSKRSAH